MFETNNNDITYRTKQEILDAAKYRGKPGRPAKINEPCTARNIRIPDRVWDKILVPKSDHVRDALEKITNNENKVSIDKLSKS